MEKADTTNLQIQSIAQSVTENVHSFATINEQSANFEEVSRAAQSLSEISDKLFDAIQFFQLS